MSRSSPWPVERALPWWPAVAGVAAVILLAVGVSADLTDGFDRAIIDFVRGSAISAALLPLRWITELGSTGAVTVVAVVTLAVGVLIGPWLQGLAGAITIGLASAGNQALKAVMARERPDLLDPIVVEHGFSFPSGHALLSMVAYGILAVLIGRSRLPVGVRRAALLGCAALIFLVGISRIWLGVHYPTDVIAGWTAGGVIVLAFARLSRSVSPAPAEAAVDADPAAPRSDPPAPG
jgi:membrane-associated phospholipid phosphatase